jgi:hypothetical protein
MNTTTPVFLGTNKKIARMAGLFYLLFIIATAIADAIRTKFIVDGDAIATALNIQTSEMLFRCGFLSDILAGILFLLAAWALYVLLKPVNKHLALLFLLLNLGGVAVQVLNMLNLLSAVLLLGGKEYLGVIPSAQLQAAAMFFLNLHKNGFMIAQFFFAAWLFPLGYLIFKSGYLPKLLGIVVMVECFAWLLFPLQFFFFPNLYVTYLSSAIGFIGEFSLTLWLLIMGARDQSPALAEVH